MTAQTEDLIERLEGEARSWESTRAEDFTPLPFESLLTEAAQALRSLQEEVERMREAVTPSAETKCAYIGEFKFRIVTGVDEDGHEEWGDAVVPWDTTKEIMAAIRARSALNTGSGEG